MVLETTSFFIIIRAWLNECCIQTAESAAVGKNGVDESLEMW